MLWKRDSPSSFKFIFFVVCVQLSFQMWTKQMQEMLNARKKADVNFREKDFVLAIDRYSEVSLRK